MNALNDGAYLYLEKPLHEDIVKYLWQFVLRKKIQREKAREELVENGDQIKVGDADDTGNINIIGEKNMPINIKEPSNNIDEVENDVESNEKYKLKRKSGRKNAKEINVVESQSSANKVVRRKVCTEWTVDLHAKFAKAVHQLGCYPKGILKVMNVHGLTRMQVASHLQKCRKNNWRIPEERKYVRHSSGQASSSGSRQRSSFRKFGTMPHLQINNPNLQQQQCNRDQTQRGPESMFPPINTTNSLVRGESSTQQQLYRPQIQVQPHYLSIANPFNNQIFLTQNNIAGGLQQLHEPLFGMLGSQGLQNSIIGSTNYVPGLTFNNGNNYIQSDYNLDLNAAHAIHSGSAIIHGTAIGNATFYELEAANATFQQYIGESSNIIAASHASDVKDAYFDFNNINYLFQNLGPPSANLPNEYGSMLDQVYSNDQAILFRMT
ncbi:hypothetical protein K7X08_000224 [Anisodus acutangulus]|uniref:HTH myb-type domain-containing protein n=1 Tax=Anisodus acutangulus TaxID=402998 RepID=A0A9Q1RCV0_9SOLA|nr:hypothetical protein K7X08_000224 [Anisodus acutangulus]